MQKMLVRDPWRLTFAPGWVVLLKCSYLPYSKLQPPSPVIQELWSRSQLCWAQTGVCHLTGLPAGPGQKPIPKYSPDPQHTPGRLLPGAPLRGSPTGPETAAHPAGEGWELCSYLGIPQGLLLSHAFRDRVLLGVMVPNPAGDGTPHSHPSTLGWHRWEQGRAGNNPWNESSALLL